VVDEWIPEPVRAEYVDLTSPRIVPVIGVCGGSGAGKTHLVRQLNERCAAVGLRVAHVSFDAYYHDLNHLTTEQRRAVNFDHPDSLDGELFAHHIHRLAIGGAADVPLYDFATHSRTGETHSVGPADVLVVDGILLLAFEGIRSSLDLSVYLDVPVDLRLDRRVARDTIERGREVAAVERQWREFVDPMHAQFVEPHAADADLLVHYGDDRELLLDRLMSHIPAGTHAGSAGSMFADRRES